MKPHDIHRQLDEHDIMESGTQNFSCKFYSTDIGSYLDERFLHLLDNSFGDFNDGEIVCMKKYVLEDDSDEEREDEIPFTCTQEKTEQERTSTVTEEELRKQIRKQVIEIWQVENEKDKKSLLRRLMFQWHPDKNPDRKEMCTRLFQYIRSLVGRLERGETIPEEDTDSDSAPGPSQTYEHTFRPPPPQYTNPRRTSGGSHERFASRSGDRSRERNRRRMGDRRESRKWWSHQGFHELMKSYPRFLSILP
ncbi:hypothetical protein Pcinc_014390 [Petrolisthes cinctipes]|uniref:Uncharacterized protein n=1 Tax=Petrolisthes cinctipes TaxID=88211 RepID=A0AAE1FWZ9_PETCI|nr:hypothetical protein Pcinc_014390 [Petrolisthes cinctipes]